MKSLFKLAVSTFIGGAAIATNSGIFTIKDYVTKPATSQPIAKIDYSQHGANWAGTCTNSNSKEQSPLNLSWEEATGHDDIRYEILYQHKLQNATVSIEGEGSMIRIDYPNSLDNDIRVYNQFNEMQTYHLSHMLWKVPSEHTIDNR